MERERFQSRTSFILASIGSAVGLGNALRFPGLCALYGGGAFLLVYVTAMVLIGIPILCMEIALGRQKKSGVPGVLRSIFPRSEWIGWASTANSFVISTYYGVIFAWILLMVFAVVPVGGMEAEDAAGYFMEHVIQATGAVSLKNEGWKIPPWLLIALAAGWGIIYYCIRNGASSVSKVVKYTVIVPVILLVILAIRGVFLPHTKEAFRALFIPDWKELKNPHLWINAIGQVFFSMSIMMGVMFAYGSFLQDKSNVAWDSLVIAGADLGVSLLSAVVLFTTMYGFDITIDTASSMGIAFSMYPVAFTQITSFSWMNAVFGVVFYLALASLAVDSAFSMIEAVATPIADAFEKSKHKVTISVTIISAVCSLVFATRAGYGWLNIVDNWANTFNIVIVGFLECVVVGWFYEPEQALKEVNRNTKKYHMPAWWFIGGIRYVAPFLLAAFLGWQMSGLVQNGFRYESYPLYAQAIGGWLMSILVFTSGLIIGAFRRNLTIEKKHL